MQKGSAFALIVLFLLFAPGETSSQGFRTGDIPWNVARVDLKAERVSVARLLEDFGQAQGIPVTVGERVAGNISGDFSDVQAQVLLDAICEANGLAWFFDGAQIYIDRSRDMLTRHLLAATVTSREFDEVASALGFASGPEGLGGSVRSSPRAGFISLSGVPSFVEMAEVLVKDLDSQEETRLREEVVSRQFRLTYASASDITVDSGSTTTEIAGVARILQETLGVQSGPGLSTGDVRYRSPTSLVSRRSAGLTAATALNPLLGFEEEQFFGSPGQQQTDEGPEQGEGEDQFQPSITANSRLNAVVVRDVVGKMPIYEELIAELDVPTQIIEIRASIVDVDANNRRAFSTEFLGNYITDSGDLRRFGFDADRGLFDGNDNQGSIPSFVDGDDLVRGVGGRFSTILTGSNWELLTRVKALEEKGFAQLVTSPMVLTEENRAATIRFDESVYVRLEGERDVDLTEVTTGTELRVTPTVVEKDGVRKFMLQIEITDGSFNDTSVDDIPTTSESAITTRAMIPDSRTLLLGGGFVERQFNNRRQIPILGDIPIAGRLFGAREKQHVRAQRFFFLTPRLIDVSLDSQPIEREDPESIPGGNMDLTRLVPLPHVSPTRIEEQARKKDYELTAPQLPPYLGDKPEKVSRYFRLPPPFDFKGKSRVPEGYSRGE